MKKLILLLILGVSLFANELNWLDDFEDAKYLAKKENKLVMMFISSPTCHVCNYMKENIFTVKEIKDYLNKNMVLLTVELGMDEPPEGFTYIGTPTTYFVRGDSSVVGKPIIGGTKPDYYIKKLQPYVDQK